MNKANIIFILSYLISNLVCAQDLQKLYDQQVIQNNEIRIQLNEKQKELDKLQAEKQAIEKEVAQSGNLKTDYNRLIVENTQLLSEKNKLVVENNELKNDIQKLTSDNRLMINENKDLSSEKNRLKSEHKALLNENDQLKLEKGNLIEEKTKLRSTVNDLTDVHAKLELTNKTLAILNDKRESELKQMVTENNKMKIDIQKIKDDYNKLQGYSQALSEENKQIKIENQQLSDENARFRQEKQNPNLENSTLNELLAESFKSITNFTVNSSQYDLKKTRDLLSKYNCASVFFKANEGDSLVTKLNQYKQLCSALEDAQNVLNKPYDKASCNRVSDLLAKCPVFNKTQLDDIASYKKLIQDYCAKSDYCAKHMVTVKKYQENYPDDAKKELDSTINNIDKKYTFLIKELNAKKQNLKTYECNFPTNCN